jgi:hypothetical protein
VFGRPITRARGFAVQGLAMCVYVTRARGFAVQGILGVTRMVLVTSVGAGDSKVRGEG